MIWAALQFAGGWLRNALGAVFSAVLRYPRETAIIALCVLSVVLWRSAEHARDQRDTWHRAHDARVKAEQIASAAQKAMNAKTQRTYQEASNAAQERYDARSDRVRGATADFVLARRLRPGQCAPGRGDPTPEAGGAAVPENASPDPVVVAVSQRDVETCAANYAYARSAYEWADSLLKAGVAK